MRRLLAAAAAVVLLASCTDDDKASPKPGTTEVQPVKGGVLKLGVTRVGSLDPAQARIVEQLLVADQLFDALTTPDPESMQPVPALAARWEASIDQKQWDFFLRPGATFANGRPITSADVKYTLERVARPATGSPASDLLQPVTGYAVFAAGQAPELAGITTPAPEHVRISLDAPMSVLASVLSSPVFGVVPREAVEAQAPPFAEAPVGSGPFAFEAVRDNVVSLVPAAGREAFVERVEFHQFDDVAGSYRAFGEGDLHWSRVPPGEVAAARSEHGDELYRPYVAELFYGFNLKSPKFADVRFRQAIVHAVNRVGIARAVYGGTVLTMNGLVVQGVAEAVPDGCGTGCANDVARAKALLAEAFPGAAPPEIFLDYDEDETQTAVAKAIQAGLQEAGITATLRAKPLKDYQSFAVSGGQELFRLGWIGAYPNADAFLHPLFATGSPSNLTGFSSPSVDNTLAAARAEPGARKRQELYAAAEKEILAAVPVIPIAQFELHSVAADGVNRLRPTTAGTFDASVVWLEER